jgi:hypothetical protein
MPPIVQEMRAGSTGRAIACGRARGRDDQRDTLDFIDPQRLHTTGEQVMAAAPLPGTSLPASAHRRRWRIVAGIAAVLLVAYALALTWAAQRLETDLKDSIRPLPTEQSDHR